MSKEAYTTSDVLESTDEGPIGVRWTRHDWNGHEPLSSTVIEAVSTAIGVEPMELATPLVESVDPDALDAIFRPRHDGSPRCDDGRVQFTTNGYEVVVRSDGRISVCKL